MTVTIPLGEEPILFDKTSQLCYIENEDSDSFFSFTSRKNGIRHKRKNLLSSVSLVLYCFSLFLGCVH